MLGTCPDIAYAVTLMAWMSANPTQKHLDKAMYICYYLISTCDYSLVSNGNSGNDLIVYTDSDWDGSPEDSKSTSGFYIKLANIVFVMLASLIVKVMSKEAFKVECKLILYRRLGK